MYQFNSPIGYSKKPLLYGKSNQADKHVEEVHMSVDFLSRSSLDTLPEEILSKIIHYLDQFDSIRLMHTNKKWYRLVRAKLYENIIIDSNYSKLSEEFSSYKYQFQYQRTNARVDLTTTFIKNTYSIKKFFSTYDGTPIRRFQCISFPESVTVFDPEISDQIALFFKKLTGLNELVWLPDNFKMDFLQQLDLVENDLFSLVINIRFDSYMKNQNLDILHQFKNLTNFQIGPYSRTENLQRIVDLVDTSQLRVLKLFKLDKEKSVPDPTANQLLSLPGELRPYELNDIEVFILKRLPYLRKLSLKGLILSQSDSKALKMLVHLENLVKLELSNISEYKISLEDSFLLEISQDLSNLRELLLNYRESTKDNIPGFLNALGNLKKLDLTVYLNNTKSFSEAAYNSALDKQVSTLTSLSIETKQETDLRYRDVPIDLKKIDLTKFTRLQAIRLNSTDEADNICLVSNLQNLTHLDLFGLKAGGSPNLGLGMIHPTVFDEWFKVQHVALIYLETNPNLHYIKINHVLFECEHKQVIPREGISNWFDEKVRVKGIDYN